VRACAQRYMLASTCALVYACVKDGCLGLIVCSCVCMADCACCHVYVCMCVCACACVCICVRVRVCMCDCVCVCVHVFACACVYMHACVYVHVLLCACNSTRGADFTCGIVRHVVFYGKRGQEAAPPHVTPLVVHLHQTVAHTDTQLGPNIHLSHTRRRGG